MRSLLALVLLCGTPSTAQAQLTWVPCTMPVNTLTTLTMGPYGELVTLLNTNPAQVRMSTDQGQSWQNHAGTGGPNGTFLSDTRLHMTNAATILVWGSANGGSSLQRVAQHRWRRHLHHPRHGQRHPGQPLLHGFQQRAQRRCVPVRRRDPAQHRRRADMDQHRGCQHLRDMAVANTTNLWAVQLGVVYRGGLDGTGFAAISTGGVQVTNGLGHRARHERPHRRHGRGGPMITTTDNGNTGRL